MPCGGCGKNRTRVNSPKRRKSTGVRAALNKSIEPCPICKSPLRKLHQYEISMKRVIKKKFCTNKECANYNKPLEK